MRQQDREIGFAALLWLRVVEDALTRLHGSTRALGHPHTDQSNSAAGGRPRRVRDELAKTSVWLKGKHPRLGRNGAEGLSAPRYAKLAIRTSCFTA
jgi:hypothetical protein